MVIKKTFLFLLIVAITIFFASNLHASEKRLTINGGIATSGLVWSFTPPDKQVSCDFLLTLAQSALNVEEYLLPTHDPFSDLSSTSFSMEGGSIEESHEYNKKEKISTIRGTLTSTYEKSLISVITYHKVVQNNGRKFEDFTDNISGSINFYQDTANLVFKNLTKLTIQVR